MYRGLVDIVVENPMGRGLASAFGTSIPYFLAGVTGEPSLTRADGIHPVAKGYRIATETVYPYLLQALERTNKGTTHP